MRNWMLRRYLDKMVVLEAFWGKPELKEKEKIKIRLKWPGFYCCERVGE